MADARQAPQGEQNRCLLGDGVIPIREMIGALTAGGFQGFFDIELTGEDVEDLEYAQILRDARLAVTELVGT